MIREKSERNPGPLVIDLSGPDGNTHVLIGLAEKFGRALGRDPKERGAITAEMMSGDYENLLQVLDREYGDFVILQR